MNWLAQTTMLSFGWRRFLLLLIAGAVAGLSMPPLFFLPLIFLAFPIWVWALDGAEEKTGLGRIFGPAFSIGLSFGLGYFLVALHWLGAAFFVDGGWLLILMPFAVLALSAVLAMFWGFASSLAFYFWSDSAWRILALAFFLTTAEILRGHLFSGFPFDLLGYALSANDMMAQITSVIGIYGLSAITALIAFMPALIWPADNRALTRRLIPFFTIIVIIVVQMAYGQYRLDSVKIIEREDIKLRLVQPNIKQAQKWQAGASDMIMERLISLSKTKLNASDAGLNGITYVIWPEAAIPSYLSQKPQYVAQIGRMLPLGKYLITGAPRDEILANGERVAYNSIMMFNSSGEVVDSYDKIHLVPFGEYLPFENIFKKFGLKQFVPGNDGWKAGKTRSVMSANSIAPFLPLICYEAIFSASLGKDIKNADFILNLTNDGWFDGSIGLEQHFHHVKIRAIEEGRSLVRVANTGITALIDPLGRVRAQINIGEAGILDISPPRPLAGTFFTKYKNNPLFLVLFIVFLGLVFQKIRNRRIKNL